MGEIKVKEKKPITLGLAIMPLIFMVVVLVTGLTF